MNNISKFNNGHGKDQHANDADINSTNFKPVYTTILFMDYCVSVFEQFHSSIPSISHLEGSSTSVGRPGNCQSPVLAIENVDVCQPILLYVSFDGVHLSQCRSSSLSHTFYHHVQHYMAFISTSDMSIPA